MCKVDGESVDHLFLYCALARELWTMVFSLFGMYWVMSKRIVDVLASWKGRLGRHKNRYIWEAVPYCVMWCLWRERNARTFEDREQNILDLKILFLRTLFLIGWLSLVCFLSLICWNSLIIVLFEINVAKYMPSVLAVIFFQ
jgi:hypothetical protein